MKLISSIYNDLELKLNINYLDGAILMVPYLALNYDKENNLNVDEAIKLLNDSNKIVILGINKIFKPSEIDMAKEFINKYKDLNLYFYTADMGINNILIELGMSNKIIYNPETMITNYLDLSVLNEFKFDAYGLSLEITLNDLKLCYEKTNANIIYQLFGYRLMFYSNRQLLSLYEKKINMDIPKEGYLKEITRNDYNPIIENENGTLIYRPYIVSMINEFRNLSFLKYGYIESYNIDKNTYQIILKTFYDLNLNKITNDEAINIINNLNLNISDGFKYKDSVYQKEELKIG